MEKGRVAVGILIIVVLVAVIVPLWLASVIISSVDLTEAGTQ